MNKKNIKYKSANPIFEEWITEWRDEAIARDLQSKHTYSKCLNSLKKYPLPLKSGKECLILEGFGDKICKLIDEKLQAFLNEGGVLHEEEDDLVILSDKEQEKDPVINEKRVNKKKQVSVDSESDFESDVGAKSQPLGSNYPNLFLKPSNKQTNNNKKSSNQSKPRQEQISDNELQNENENVKKLKKKSRTKEYLPEFRSGAYALLITLLKNEESNSDPSVNYMLKNQLIKEAQKHSDSQFTSSDPRNHYTAWNSMSNLVKKLFVERENKLPARYRLTDSGRDLARKLLYGIETESNKPSDSESENEYSKNKKVSKLSTNIDKIVSSQEVKKVDDCIEILDSDSLDSDIVPLSVNKPRNEDKKIDSDDSELEDLCEIQSYKSTGLTQQFDTKTSLNCHLTIQDDSVLLTLEPGTFDIILFVDNCEQSHAKRQDLLIDELKKANLKYEFGKLNIGDFAWIARSRKGANFLNTDLILNYIVERKRMDDLCQSIIDGRYKEQKFRLKKSGITHAIYLIEDYGSMKHMSLPEKSLIQADVNTQIIDHLIVHHTTDPKDSAYYLIHMTKYLTDRFKNQTLKACLKKDLDNMNKNLENKKQSLNYLMTFKEFNEFSNKNKPLSIKEMFAKCLMKIQGVSQEKCLAILDLYETPSKLVKEYSKCADESSRIKLLSNIKYGSQQRNIGPAIAKLIAQLFYTNAPLS